MEGEQLVQNHPRERLVRDEQLNLVWKEFYPHPKSISGREINSTEVANDLAKRAVISLPGTFEVADAPSNIGLKQSLADYSGCPTLAFPPNQNPETLRKFIEKNAFDSVTLIGYSQGGTIATELAYLLQTANPKIVDGLILLAPMGLYKQSGVGLALRFIADTIIKTPITLLRSRARYPQYFEKGMQVAKEAVKGGGSKELGPSINSFTELRRQVNAMAEKNPHLKDIKAPVVIVQGNMDMVSEYKRVVPSDSQSREDFLTQNIFPDAPYIRMLVPKKGGNHGFAIFRDESVARAACGLLKRWKRQQKDIEK